MLILERRYVLGRKKEIDESELIDGKFISIDPKHIAKINAELRKKCEKQRENDAEAEIWAKEHGCM